MSAKTMLALTVRRRFLNSWHKKAPYPPYSPDLASCDFYLVGYIKVRLAGTSFEEPDQLLQVIDMIFQCIKKPYWNAYFRSRWAD
jgi:hypothetical protein